MSNEGRGPRLGSRLGLEGWPGELIVPSRPIDGTPWTPPTDGLWTNGYITRDKLVASRSANLAATLTNAIVRFDFTYPSYRSSANGGVVLSDSYDFRFELADGTKLAHVIVGWSATTGRVHGYVKIPSLAPLTVVYMFAGKAGLSSPEGSWPAVFGADLACWDTLTGKDLSGHERNLTPTGVANTGSLLGMMVGRFNGASSMLMGADRPTWADGLSAITIEAWAWADSPGGRGAIVGVSPTPTVASDAGMGALIRYDEAGDAGGAANTVSAKVHTSVTASRVEAPANTRPTLPTFYALSWATGEAAKLYINGKPVTPSNVPSAAAGTTNVSRDATGRVVIGKNLDDVIDSTSWWKGDIGLVRILDRVKSQAELAHQTLTFARPDVAWGSAGPLTTTGVLGPVVVPGAFDMTDQATIDIDVVTDAVLPAGSSSATITAIMTQGTYGTAAIINSGATVRYTRGAGFPTLYSDTVRVRLTDDTGKTNECNLLIVGTVLAPSTTYSNGYKGQMKYVLPAASNLAGADITNFPLLIEDTFPDWKSEANSGQVKNGTYLDFRCELADGTKLDHFVQDYDAATGKLRLRVRIPTFSASVDTPFYVYYGKTLAATEENSAGVTQDYLAWWNARTGAEYTTNARTLTPSNMSAGTLLGDAGVFNGTTSRLLSSTAPTYLDGLADLQVEAWAQVDAAVGGGSLAVVDRTSYNTTSTVATHNFNVTVPAGVTGILVLFGARANGASVTYTPTCTIGGNAATRLAGNAASASADFNAIQEAFFLHSASGYAAGTLAISVAMGNTVRPAGADIIFLSGTTASTGVGASTVARFATTGTTSLGSLTPTSLIGMCFIQGQTVIGSGTPTLSSYTPTGQTDLGTKQLGSTLGLSALRSFVPTGLTQVDATFTWSASSTSRGILMVELLRGAAVGGQGALVAVSPDSITGDTQNGLLLTCDNPGLGGAAQCWTFQVKTSAGTSRVEGPANQQDSTPVYLAAQKTAGAAAKLFVGRRVGDGGFVTPSNTPSNPSGNTSITATGAKLRIGEAGVASPTRWFKGTADEIRIRASSQSEGVLRTIHLMERFPASMVGKSVPKLATDSVNPPVAMPDWTTQASNAANGATVDVAALSNDVAPDSGAKTLGTVSGAGFSASGVNVRYTKDTSRPLPQVGTYGCTANAKTAYGSVVVREQAVSGDFAGHLGPMVNGRPLFMKNFESYVDGSGNTKYRCPLSGRQFLQGGFSMTDDYHLSKLGSHIAFFGANLVGYQSKSAAFPTNTWLRIAGGEPYNPASPGSFNTAISTADGYTKNKQPDILNHLNLGEWKNDTTRALGCYVTTIPWNADKQVGIDAAAGAAYVVNNYIAYAKRLKAQWLTAGKPVIFVRPNWEGMNQNTGLQLKVGSVTGYNWYAAGLTQAQYNEMMYYFCDALLQEFDGEIYIAFSPAFNSTIGDGNPAWVPTSTGALTYLSYWDRSNGQKVGYNMACGSIHPIRGDAPTGNNQDTVGRLNTEAEARGLANGKKQDGTAMTEGANYWFDVAINAAKARKMVFGSLENGMGDDAGPIGHGPSRYMGEAYEEIGTRFNDPANYGIAAVNAILGGYTIDKRSDPACAWVTCTTALTQFTNPAGNRRRHGCNAHAYGATFSTDNNKSNYARGVETIQKYFGKVGHATLGSGVVPRAPLTTEN